MARLKASSMIETLAAMTILAFTLSMAMYTFSSVLDSDISFKQMRAEKRVEELIESTLRHQKTGVFVENEIEYMVWLKELQHGQLMYVRVKAKSDKRFLVEKHRYFLMP